MRSIPKRAIFILAVLICISSWPAAGLAGDWPIDFMERIFGPTDINGVTGNSSLTAALSSKGKLTVLRWPSPGYYDQMGFLTISRDLDRMGARPNAGSFAGLYLVDRHGQGTMTWLVDDPRMRQYAWEHYENLIVPVMAGERGGTYLGLDTITMSHIWAGDEEMLELVREALDFLVRDVPTRQTGLSGEVYVPVEDENGDVVFECRTGIPQLMQACLTYITAMALYGPR